jgi:zinc protease
VLAVVPAGARAEGRPEGPGAPLVARRLDNGLNVILHEDHRVPLVAVVVNYAGGTSAAPPGLSGIASLVNALVLRKTEHVPEGGFKRLLEAAGGTWQFGAGYDNSIFKVQVPSNRLALALWLLSDQMGFFERALDDADLEVERDLLSTEIRSRFETQPRSRLEAIADEDMFPEGHRYRHGIVDSAEEIGNITRADVLAFHHAWFSPDHATIAVVGDVTPPDAMAQVERYFATIPPSGAAPRPDKTESFRLAGEMQVDVAANVPVAFVDIRWPTPRNMTTDDAALDVLARLLAGKHTAWLYWRLVDKEKVARRVWVRQESRDFGSEFEVEIEGAPGSSPTQLLDAFDAALVDLSTRRPTTLEESMATYETIVPRISALDDIMTRASLLTRYVQLVGTPDYFKHDLGRYKELSGPLGDAIPRFLPRDRRIVLLVKPDATAPVAGARVGRRFVPAGTP